ncbi:YwiC-like family protein [Bacillus sp. FJAT-45350]|uniref:YwiC-like family protein n=1 Tax=Bacillus sp. FJAT-45350 TaxID=2011014 RepID=UPI0015C9D3CC|nr:YwiC-like family protein [Bacillus sp. FJAT-45350]
MNIKWFIPREHGAWAMLIVPLLLGTFISNPSFTHLYFIIGVLSLYFGTGPLLAYIRKPRLGKTVLPSFMIYTICGLIFLVPVLYKHPFLLLFSFAIIPLFFVNILFARKRNERSFSNDLVAILALSFLVPMTYYIGNNAMTSEALILMSLNFAFFIGSVFHVKTFIREKDNKKFLRLSNGYHGATVIIPFLIGYPIFALAFAFSTIKTWVMPKGLKIKPITLGLVELTNSIFFVLVILLFRT